MRAVHLLPILGVAACGLPSGGQRAAIQSGGAAAWAERAGDHLEMVVAAVDTDGTALPIARLAGVRLVLGESADDWLPFVDARRDGDTLHLSCPERDHHAVSLEVRGVADGGLELRLEDRVGLESGLRELSLAYVLESPANVNETWLPHVPAPASSWVGDLAWPLPLAFLRAGQIALAVEPDVELLARERPVRQGLAADAERGTLRHGLVALAEEEVEGALRFSLGGSVSVQGEALTLAHRLHPVAGAAAGTLPELASEVWRRRVAWITEETSRPIPGSWDREAERVFLAELPDAWAEISLGSRRAAAAALGLAGETHGFPSADAWFTAERNQLETALGLLLFAERTGREPLRQRAVQLVDLLMQAPRRLGVFPAVIAFDPPGGRLDTASHGAGPAAIEGHHRALDLAVTGHLLLELGRRLPDRRAELLEACRGTARFLIANQLQSGALPAYFEERFLAPRRSPLYDSGLETAAAALFLARFGELAPDEEAKEAAWHALQFLAGELERGDLRDARAAVLSGRLAIGDDPPVPPVGTLGVAMAARAALAMSRVETGLEEGRRRRSLALAEDFLARLATLQTVWERRWAQADRLGSMVADNLGIERDDPAQVVAAEAFLSGYERTGRRELLQRGALALRAALWNGRSSRSATLRWTATAAAEGIRERMGQAVIDLGGRFGEGLDDLWVTDLQVQPGEIRFQVFTRAEGVEQALVRFRRVPQVPGGYRVVVGDRGFEPLSADDLQRGVLLPVRRLPVLEFAPPGEIAADLPWEPWVRWSGPMPEDIDAVLEVRHEGGLLEEIALLPEREEKRLLARQPFSPRGLALGDTLELRVRMRAAGAEWFEPIRGHRRVMLAAAPCIDPGDDDEHLMLDPGSSRVGFFADGRQGCRTLPPGTSATWAIPVPEGVAQIDLSIELRGAARVQVAGDVLYEDTAPTERARRVGLELGDRRLWRQGRLELTATALAQPLEVARIRYRTTGGASELPMGVARRPEGLASTLRVVVVPLDLLDVRRRASTEAVRQACFGGPEYRLTPAPESRRTAGSTALLVGAMSGGLTSLVGTVLEPLQVDVLASDLARRGDGGRASLEQTVREHLRRVSDETPVDLVLAVHGRSDDLRPLAEPVPGSPPVLFLAERERDGSMLASGTILAALLRARYGLVDLEEPDGGAFGELALSSTETPHIPPGPIGIHLEQIGWADRIELRPAATDLLPLPVLQLDRAFFVLECSEMPGRGDLVIEERREGPGEPGLGAGGTLIYWDLRRAPPVLAGEDGALAQPRFLRMSLLRTSQPTPFHPATSADLLRGAEILGAETSPSLATPQGEAAWTVDLRTAPSGRRTARVTDHLQRGLPWERAAWTTAAPGRGPAPLPWNTAVQDTGQVGREGRALALTPHPLPGGRVRGEVSLPGGAGPLRLFCRLTCDGSDVAVRFGVDDVELLRARPVSGDAWMHLDLPAPHPGVDPVLWLAVDTLGAAPKKLIFDPFVLAPRQSALFVMPGRGRTPAQEAWMDGDYHSEVLRLSCDPRGTATVRTPIVLPQSRARLRLLAGMPASVPPGTVVRLSVVARSHDRSWRSELLSDFPLRRIQGPQPMLTALLELPAQATERLAFLEMTLTGPAGAALYFQAVEIVR